MLMVVCAFDKLVGQPGVWLSSLRCWFCPWAVSLLSSPAYVCASERVVEWVLGPNGKQEDCMQGWVTLDSKTSVEVDLAGNANKDEPPCENARQIRCMACLKDGHP